MEPLEDRLVLMGGPQAVETDLVGFAQALADADVKFFGAAWCPACRQQKELFQDGAQFLPFIEVTNPDRTLNQTGIDEGIQQFPTWEFPDGTRLEGIASLATLSTRSNVAIPTSNGPFIAPVELDGATITDNAPMQFGIDGYDPNGDSITYTVTTNNPLVEATVLQGNRSLNLAVSGFGMTTYQLFEGMVPGITGRIATLANDGHYDGLDFFQAVEGLGMLAGDPNSDSGLGFLDDEFHPDLTHNRAGLLTTGNNATDENDSKIIVTDAPATQFDQSRSAFGVLVEGEKVRDAMNATEVDDTDTPVSPLTIESATVTEDNENAVIMVRALAGAVGLTTITVTADDGNGNTFTRTFQVQITGDTIVTFNTSLGAVNVELFPELAPATVENFLNYVNDGDYVNAIAHRSLAGFVVQGGGFSYDGSTFTDLPADPPVINEFGRSNVRGTIAMAKLGSDPNSATIEWFFNLGDNSENLDNQNGGFTVFGEVVSDADMAVVDAIAALPTFDASVINGAFSDLPLRNLPAGTEITGTGSVSNDNVVLFESIVQQEMFAQVAGIKFEDLNGNGLRDEDEEVLEGWTIFLDDNVNGVLDAGERSTVTDAEGRYTFANLSADTPVVVTEQLQPGWTQTTPELGFFVVPLTAGEFVGDLDFGNVLSGAPSAEGDSYNAVEDTQLVVVVNPGQQIDDGVLANDSDPDNNPLTAVLVAGAEHGSVNLAADGSFTYTPNADHNGLDSFTYRAQNENGTPSGTVTVEINVAPTNDPPSLAQPPAVSVDKNTSLHSGELDLTSLVTDIDGDTSFEFRITNLAEIEAAFGLSDGNNDGTNGEPVVTIGDDSGSDQFQNRADNSLHVHPRLNFIGSVDVKIQARDVSGALSEERTFTLNIQEKNTPPTADDDTATVVEDTPTVIDLINNDTDVDGQIDGNTIEIVTQPTHGTLALHNNGTVTYTPETNYTGSDVFEYFVRDDRGAATNPAQADITVTPVNDAPTAVNDQYTVNEDGALNVSAANGVIENNDSDPDGDNLTATETTGPSNGTLQLNADGSFIYTPNANFNGTDSFAYGLSDGQLASNAATVTVVVNSQNDAPQITDPNILNYAINEDGVLDVASGSNVLDAAFDIDDDPLNALLISNATNGVVQLLQNGTFTYTPNPNYNGPDSFTFSASDGLLSSAVTTVAINVTAVADSPAISPGGPTPATAGTVATFTVTATDPDNSGAAIQFALEPGAPGGAAIDPNTGVVTWQTATTDTGQFNMVVRATKVGAEQLTSTRSFGVIVTAPASNVPNTAPNNTTTPDFGGPIVNTGGFGAPSQFSPTNDTQPNDTNEVDDAGVANGTIGPNTGLPPGSSTATGDGTNGDGTDGDGGDSDGDGSGEGAPKDPNEEGDDSTSSNQAEENEVSVDRFDAQLDWLSDGPLEDLAFAQQARRSDPLWTADDTALLGQTAKIAMAESTAPATQASPTHYTVASVENSLLGGVRHGESLPEQESRPSQRAPVAAGLMMASVAMPLLVTQLRRNQTTRGQRLRGLVRRLTQ